jgi:outer membrane protein OmpA-like peptidoglycan-associated protein
MIKKFILFIGVGLQASLTFGQEGDCNKNLFSEEEALKLADYANQLENAILDYNLEDSTYIAKRIGDFSKDLCGYTDEEVIKISIYLKELEKLDSLNKANEKAKEEALTKAKEEKAKEEKAQEETKAIEEAKASVQTEKVADYDKMVYFSLNSSKVGKANLDGLVKELNENKELKVLLVGHTDASGSDNLNLNLSIQRANSVKKLLVKRGIQASRITIKGMGEDKPIADNDTEEGKAKNRRVEISVK